MTTARELQIVPRGRRVRVARVRRTRPPLARVLIAAAAAVVAILALAQVVLPRLAEHGVRSAFGSQADGVHAEIEATPAIKLLWHRADRVEITVDRFEPNTSGGGSVGETIAGLKVARELDVRIRDLRARGAHLREVTLHKDGDLVTGRADVDLRALQGILPAGLRVRPMNAPSGQIRVEGTVSALGTPVSARATLLAQDGDIVVRPEGLPLGLGSTISVPVFSDDRIAVEGISARPSEDGVLLTARARLRDA
jgi:DUF2993 family protein